MNLPVDRRLPGRIRWLLLFAVVLLSGCGQEYSVAPARGVVTVQSRPVTGGRVLFLPVAGGKQALGTIGADGTFVLTCYKNGDGAQVGLNHVVLVDVTTGGLAKPESYRAAKTNRLQVEAGKENVFAIELGERNRWEQMADD
jgi:hypothetical protein